MFEQMESGFAPPFDAPLYGASQSVSDKGEDFTIEYDDCDALSFFFTIDNDVQHLLPNGVVPSSDPALGGVFFARYPFSEVGTYNEFLSIIQVEGPDGSLAHYIPYIYVTNDAGLAAGREVVGAPKKIASIELDRKPDSVLGVLERPEDNRLATARVQPDRRTEQEVVSEFFPLGEPVPLLSVRHLPPIEGGDGVSQLVEWHTEYSIHRDQQGTPKMWSGPGTIHYESESRIDPIHNLGVGETLLASYSRFDMKLGVDGVLKEWTH